MTDPVEIVARAMVTRINAIWDNEPEDFKDYVRGHARAVLEVLRSAGLLMEWRPIEEAPKDGSEFLARTIRRYPGSKYPIYWIQTAWWENRHFTSLTGDIVTHFMLLPKPPEEE